MPSATLKTRTPIDLGIQSMAELQAYINLQNTTTGRVLLPQGDGHTITAKITIPTGIRLIDGRGGEFHATYTPGVGDFELFRADDHPGPLLLKDFSLIHDTRVTTRVVGKPALMFADCEHITLDNITILGFGGAIWFTRCQNVTIRDCHCSWASDFQIHFTDCSHIDLDNTISDFSCMDGLKFLKASHYRIVGGHFNDNGRVRWFAGAGGSTASNGNGMDLYTSQGKGYVQTECSRNMGAGIECKTAELNNTDGKEELVEIADCLCEDNAGSGVNMTNDANNPMHLEAEHMLHVGGRYKNNGWYFGLTNVAGVRIGTGMRPHVQVVGTPAGYQAQAYDSYNQENATAATPVGNGTNVAVGQSFASGVGTGTGWLSRVVAYLSKTGSPTGNITAKIYEHSGEFGNSSVPDTAKLKATSKAVNVADLETYPRMVFFEFPDPPNVTGIILSANTNYVLAIEYSGGNATNYVNAYFDGSSPTHAGNYAVSTGTWSADATKDLIFHVLRTVPYHYQVRYLDDYSALRKRVVINGVATTATVHTTTSQLTITGHTVSSADIRSLVNITGGTMTAGVYEITAVDTANNRWTLDRSAGTAGQTGIGVSTALIFCHTFDDVGGTRLDSYGSTDLTVTGRVGSSAGLVGRAARFNGTSDYLSAAHSAMIAQTTAFSIGIRWKTDNAVGTKTLISKNAQAAWAVESAGSTPRCYIGGSGNYGASANNVVFADLWYHGLWVYDGTGAADADKLKFYLNGIAQTLTFNGIIPANITNASGDLRVGSRDGSVAFYSGLVNSIDYWSVALSADNAFAWWNGGVPVKELAA